MEDGQTRPYVCRFMIQAQSTVNVIMKIAYDVKQAVQHAATVHATQVNYFGSKVLQKKNGEIIVIRVDDINKKNTSH